MSDDIDALAAMSYQRDPDPIPTAIDRIESFLQVWELMKARSPEVGLPPAWPNTNRETVAAKIVANLLNAGWSPPSAEEISAAVTASEEESRRFREWWESLPDEQRPIVLEHYSETGEFPPAWQPPRRGPR